MPSADPELRDKIVARFGGIEPWRCEDFLKTRGFRVMPDGVVAHVDGREPADDEWECIEFLFQEWDYGYTDKKVADLFSKPAAAQP